MKFALNVLLCLFLLGQIACGSKDANVKKEISLSHEDTLLMKIISDIHIAEASSRRFDMSMRDSMLYVYKNHIFRIHNMTKSRFDSTMDMVFVDQKRYLDIYSSLSDSIKNYNKVIHESK